MASRHKSACRSGGSWQFLLAALLLFAVASAVGAASQQQPLQPPAWLPRYDLDIGLHLDRQQVVVRQRVIWTNPHGLPTSTLVFNAHSRYSIPDKDIGLLAKTLEILRLAPSEGLDFDGPALEVQTISLLAPVADGSRQGERNQLLFRYRDDNPTALEVDLPTPVGPGESVAVELAFTLRLPQKQGRWGQWQGVTYLAQWLPVLACYGEAGWQPVPFIPWHQPFFNEAGVYTARVTLPVGQKLACTGQVCAARDLGNGTQLVEVGPVCARDFSLFCSARYEEHLGQTADGVRVRCLALPGHDFYAREMGRIACEALPAFTRCFGPYPYPEFTIVESFFGWNGNECGGVVMIDSRIFGLPHLARNFVDYLVSHEICHQWWYNVVGTNGYAETWMDEGVATYFAHQLMDAKLGKNNKLLDWPSWLPNIRREDYRHYGLLGTIGRGEASAAVQPIPEFGHLVNLSSMTYDRGSKIVGMIEERLGRDAMRDFMRCVYRKYAFRILRVDDFRRELEAYTRQSWQGFFQNWLYSAGMTDWCLENVQVERLQIADRRFQAANGAVRRAGSSGSGPLARPQQSAISNQQFKATVLLREQGKCNEPTVLGFALSGGDEYQVRVPVIACEAGVQIDDASVRVESLGGGRVRVETLLPCRPTQVTIDPDQVLLDADPGNNRWKSCVNFRLTPFYTQLDETDLTNAYDRWNVVVGPWFYGSAYRDPWYTRSAMVGLRAGVYRTQQASAGTYLAYRTDDRNIIAGVDGIIDHWPESKTEIGFNVERSLTTLGDGFLPCSRAVLFGRYIFMYSDSLYLPPFHYVEAFGSVQDRCLPDPSQALLRDDAFDQQTILGIHYHLYLLTPYWDPEGGLALDATYQGGLPILGAREGFQQVFGQFSTVKTMPGWLGWTRDVPGLHWLMDSRWAFRVYGAALWPDDGRFFALGGGEHFRGFDLRQRQGSMAWIGSVEWRIPVLRGLTWDVCDHVAGLRNVYAAPFYDVGDMYLNGRSLGPVAHAVGAGLRLDVAWFGMIERTMLRFDFAKTINADTPWQFWLGVQHAF